MGVTPESRGEELASGAADRAAEAEFLRTWGPLPPFKVCPIGWQPSALAPVFYGYRDYASQFSSELATAPGGVVVRPAPVNLRVFFPSLDGSPQYASMLANCGRYPLILFAHGDCNGDPDHYLKWYELPAQLARAGYVVAVPQVPDIAVHPSANIPAQTALLDVLSWMRETWEYADTLMPAPATGLAGHSYGAMNVSILSARIDVRCVAMLSAPWTDWSAPPWPFTQVAIPQLFTWGSGDGDIYAQLPDNLWDETALPRHRAIFAGAYHFDYLYQTPLPCRQGAGTCPWVGAAAADYTTMFFARYLPPEFWPNLPDEIPASLQPPPLTLTPDQQFYGGSYLQGLQAFDGSSGCAVTVSQEIPAGLTVPFVRYLPASKAASLVEMRGFVPVFTGPAGASAWVAAQEPLPGTPASPGSDVRMELSTGRIP